MSEVMLAGDTACEDTVMGDDCGFAESDNLCENPQQDECPEQSGVADLTPAPSNKEDERPRAPQEKPLTGDSDAAPSPQTAAHPTSFYRELYMSKTVLELKRRCDHLYLPRFAKKQVLVDRIIDKEESLWEEGKDVLDWALMPGPVRGKRWRRMYRRGKGDLIEDCEGRPWVAGGGVGQRRFGRCYYGGCLKYKDVF